MKKRFMAVLLVLAMFVLMTVTAVAVGEGDPPPGMPPVGDVYPTPTPKPGK